MPEQLFSTIFVFFFSMLFLIALLEGFTTLSVQMIALRLASPIVGSSIVLTSVFIGVILLALSAGYYVGGIVASRRKKTQLSVLLAGFLVCSAFYYGSITFFLEEPLLQRGLETTGKFVWTLFLVAFVLFFIPVCVNAQTIPILTELVPEESKGKSAGLMLFASTIGSFLGSVLTSIWLFETIGVRATAVLSCVLLLVCAVLLLRKTTHRKRSYRIGVGTIGFALVLYAMYMRSVFSIPGLIHFFDSAYQEILIRELVWTDGKQVKIFHTNRAFASGIYTESKESPFDYIQEVMHITDVMQPKTILVIGTAGFTYPYQLSKLPFVERIDAVDIDPTIKPIAETYFLQETLSPKVVFIPYSARYAVNQAIKEGKKYDLILLDAYNGKTLPDELTTKEFFMGVKQLTTQKGIIANFILDSKLDSVLTHNLFTTRQTVFGSVRYKNVTNNEKNTFDNFIVTAEPPDESYKLGVGDGQVYSDDKRTTETDLVKMWRATNDQ